MKDKYQKALDRIGLIPLGTIGEPVPEDGICEPGVLYGTEEVCVGDCMVEEFKLLQELVDKATPKKVVVKEELVGHILLPFYVCPRCGEYVDGGYGHQAGCRHCLQALEW